MLRVLESAEAVAREALKQWAQEARAAAACRGRLRVALSGGRTPETLFTLLAREALPWEQTEVYWVDERYVPQAHAQSNYRSARELLLSQVAIPAANVHPMPTGSGDPDRDAAAYEKLLRRQFPGRDWPAFDLVLLGIGADGHTASLFPGDAAVLERKRWVCAARSPAGVRDRLTLSLPALNAGPLKLMLVCGRDKAQALQRLTEAPVPPLAPGQLIDAPMILADRDAAALLEAA